jgi:hypothetical protein
MTMPKGYKKKEEGQDSSNKTTTTTNTVKYIVYRTKANGLQEKRRRKMRAFVFLF